MGQSGRYERGVLTASFGMSLHLKIAPAFAYAGSLLFDLAAGARVERHHFVEGARDVTRLIVVHFEVFLPGVDDHYRYALRDPAVLAGERYGRSAELLDVAAGRAAAPLAEMARTATFLASKGFRCSGRHAVARYARIVGDDRRGEILIFYHEVGGRLEGIFDRATMVLQ
ncbi:MAG TPA: hypothetical protein VEU77_03135 [Candidatus Acidoferrales bacterium]|nr:hypothetical protein [Candidatus Acidoferrales bacterium]